MTNPGLPQCKVCYKFLPESFKDFVICVACFATRERALQNRPTLRQPSYTTPHQRLERKTDG